MSLSWQSVALRNFTEGGGTSATERDGPKSFWYTISGPSMKDFCSHPFSRCWGFSLVKYKLCCCCWWSFDTDDEYNHTSLCRGRRICKIVLQEMFWHTYQICASINCDLSNNLERVLSDLILDLCLLHLMFTSTWTGWSSKSDWEGKMTFTVGRGRGGRSLFFISWGRLLLCLCFIHFCT